MGLTEPDEECRHGLTLATCSLCKGPPPVAKRWTPSRNQGDGRKTPENSTTYFDHPWPEWFLMRDAGIQYLASCASEQRKATYGELWAAIEQTLEKDLGNPWRQQPWLLEYIGKEAYRDTGLILSALVIYQEGDEHPGEGFFRLAAIVGALPEEDAPPVGEPWEEMTASQREFWNTQVRLLFEYFG